MKNIIAICGKSGAGKDSLLNNLSQKGFIGAFSLNKIISCTTRPRRDYEVNGKDYYFINPPWFFNYLNSGKLLEGGEFNGWFYGTLDSAVVDHKYSINIGVFNIDGIFALEENSNINLLTFYLDVDPETRLHRCIKRENAPDYKEIFRRFMKDEEDFLTMPKNCVIIKDDKGLMTIKDKVSMIEKEALDFFA